MFYLSDEERQTAQDLLDNLKNRCLIEMWRYAGLQSFDFRVPPLFPEDTNWQIVAHRDWRVSGPDGFSLGSWNFGRREKRFDDYAHEFYGSIETNPPQVTESLVDRLGGITIHLLGGFRIDVNPSVDVTRNGDQWRIIGPKVEDRQHLSLQGGGLHLAKKNSA